MFNDLRLRFLICTSTLIEGVNTRAKNVIVFDNKIAQKRIDYFTFNNIKGRSGRMFEHFIGRVYLFHDPPLEALPYVDFPTVSQHNAVPDSLLIQLEKPDLKQEAEERLRRFSEQHVLSLGVIRQNSGIDPGSQVQLAELLAERADEAWPWLAWRHFPSYDQLQFACELIWEHLAGSKQQHGVRSARQLALLIWQLRQRQSTRGRIEAHLKPGRYAAKSVDEAVERIQEFERNWASFAFPRYLMALSRIQEEVMSRRHLPTGDYSTFAQQVECLFHSPVVAALDEYGIPLQLAQKLESVLGSRDNLDTALHKLKELDLNRLPLTEFERDLIVDAREAL
jgi:hypothetical protein